MINALKNREQHCQQVPLRSSRSVLSSFSSPQSSIIQCKDRLGIESPPFDCEYNSIGDRLLVCNENGMITVNSRGDDELMSESLQFVGHENAIFQCKWSFDDSLIYSASADSTVKIWNLENRISIRTLKHQGQSIRCVEYDYTNPSIIATGSREGSLCMWDTRFENKVGLEAGELSVPLRINAKAHFVSFNNDKSKKNAGSSSITSVVFRNNYLFTSGASDGKVKKWDVRSTLKKPAEEFQGQGTKLKSFGINSMVFSADRSKLFVSFTNARIVEMEPSDFQLLQEFTHTDLDTNSFYVKISISPCGQYVASGSRDSNVYIWDTFCPLAPVRCIGHRAESTAVDWSPYGLELASASDDMTCRTWKPDTPLSDHDPSIGHCELLPPQVRTVAIEQAAGKSLQSSSSTLSWNSSKCILPRMDSKNSDSQYSRSWATTADQENYVENIPITVDPPRAVKTKRVRPITDFFNPLPSKRQK